MKAHIVVDLGYGDCGKGSVTDFLIRQTGAQLVVRFSGGPQASHNVHTVDGRHHAFSQFGSGSFVPGVRTYLSRFMLVEPFALLNEWRELSKKIDPVKLSSLMIIEKSAPVITPFHWILNRLRESARTRRHGSCGMGIGELRSDQTLQKNPVLRVEDLSDIQLTKQKLDSIKSAKIVEAAVVAGHEACSVMLAENTDYLAGFYESFAGGVKIVPDGSLHRLAGDGPVIFEGAQGVLLDERYGFAPYNTWTDTTFRNALQLCSPHDEVRRIGVLRTYCTRHGPGPFVSESAAVSYPDDNTTGPWQGPFRQGWFDLSAALYALECTAGVDGLALTHCDQTGNSFPIVIDRDYLPLMRQCDTQALMNAKPVQFMTVTNDGLAKLMNTAILIESYGPTANDKILRRKDATNCNHYETTAR
jgi:adenylosuccinate synthase